MAFADTGRPTRSSFLRSTAHREKDGDVPGLLHLPVPSINSSCTRLANFLQPECFGRLHVGRFKSRRRLYSGVEV